MAIDSRYRSLFFICVGLVCGLLLFLLTAHSPLNASSSTFLYSLQAQSNENKPNLANSPEAAAIVPTEPSNAVALAGGGKKVAEEEEVKAPLRVILTAFVGRRDRTHMLLAYADELIKRGYVDEVHMWDFAKDPVDRTWLRTFNGTLLATPDRHAYHHHMDVDSHCGSEAMGRSFVFTVSAANDVMIKMEFDGNVAFELVIGGHKNEMSVFRQLGRPDEFDWTNLEMFLPNGDAGFTNFHTYFNASHGIIRIIDGAEHERMKAGEVAGEFDSFQHCKTRTCWTFPLQTAVRYRRWKGVSFSTGVGEAFGYWKLDRLCSSQLASSTRYRVGYPKPTSRTPSYWQEYYRHYHHWRRSLYANTVLVKADDDTVFIDVDKFPAYIRYRLENPEPFLLFPNIINNGVAAWMQQTKQKVLPESAAGIMEYPMGEGRPGYCGSLWASSEKAYKLHSYFLTNTSHFSHPDPNVSYDIEPKLRFSINFFAVHTNHFDKFLHMWLEWDDELSITVTIPVWYNAHKALHPHMVVSHMAFGPQHQHTPQLLEGYNKLLVDKKEEWKRMEMEMQKKGETLYPPLPKQFDYHTLAPNKPCPKRKTYSTAAATAPQQNTRTTQVTRGKVSAADMKKLRGEY